MFDISTSFAVANLKLSFEKSLLLIEDIISLLLGPNKPKQQ